MVQLSESENVTVDNEALKIIANHSTGSLRDAENILEQAIVSFVDNISTDNIKEMLKIGGDTLTQKLLECIINKNLTESIQELNQMVSDGIGVDQIHASLLDSVRYLMLIKSDALNENQISEVLKKCLTDLKDQIDLSELLFISKILTKVDFNGFQVQNLGLEMALIEINLGQVSPIEIVDKNQSTSLNTNLNNISNTRTAKAIVNKTDRIEKQDHAPQTFSQKTSEVVQKKSNPALTVNKNR